MKPTRQSNLALLSDFDGTIVNIDTAEWALEHFADPSWKRIEEEFESGNISFEESLRREFAMIAAPEEVILTELDKVVALRPHFGELVQDCMERRLSFSVVSGGLDFCIRHFLDRENWLNFVEIHAAKAEYADEGYELSCFPKLQDKASINFKDDLVRRYKKLGNTVFFVGDGVGDYPAAREADFRFAIRGSKLAEICRQRDLAHSEITDFREVLEAIESFKA